MEAKPTMLYRLFTFNTAPGRLRQYHRHRRHIINRSFPKEGNRAVLEAGLSSISSIFWPCVTGRHLHHGYDCPHSTYDDKILRRRTSATYGSYLCARGVNCDPVFAKWQRAGALRWSSAVVAPGGTTDSSSNKRAAMAVASPHSRVTLAQSVGTEPVGAQRFRKSTKRFILPPNDKPLGKMLASAGRVRELVGCVDFWLRNRTAESVMNADALLRILVEARAEASTTIASGSSSDAAVLTSVQVDEVVAMVTAVLDKWRISREHEGSGCAAEKAEDLLCYLRTLNDNRTKAFRTGLNRYSHPAAAPFLTTRHYNIVMDAWSRSGRKESAKRAEALLEQLKSHSGDAGPRPDIVSYNIVIGAWARSIGKHQHPSRQRSDRSRGKAAAAARRAEAILEDMYDEELRSDNIFPNTIAYSAVIHAWSKSGDPDAGRRAERLLRKMESEHRDGGKSFNDLKPNQVTYGSVLNAWSQSNQPGSARRAEQILMQMEQKYIESGDEDIRPNIVCYNEVINAWSRSNEEGAARRAETILNRMATLAASAEVEDSSPGIVIRPNTISYNCCIAAWAKSREQGAARRAEALLSRMESALDEESASGKVSEVRPDTITFSAVIDAWSKCPEEGAAKRAEDVLRRMQQLHDSGNRDVTPNCITYTSVIDAWARDRSAGSAERAELILKKMLDLFEAGHEEVKPNTVTFNAVLNAWSREKAEGSACRAENLLNFMLDLYETSVIDIRPDRISFNACITAWSRDRRDPSSAENAEALLRRMMKIHTEGHHNVDPDKISFNATMAAWSRSQIPNRGRRAENLLREMQDLFLSTGSDRLRPDIISFNTCIYAYSRSDEADAATKAKALLKELCGVTSDDDGSSECEEGKRTLSCPTDVMPDAMTFNAVLRAIERSGEADAGEEAVRILRQMNRTFRAIGQELDATQAVIAYNSTLNACVGQPVGVDLLLIVELLEEMEINGPQPNHITYETALLAFFKLMAPGRKRDETIQTVFHRCCAAGMVSPSVVEMIKCTAPSVYREIVGPRLHGRAMGKKYEELIPMLWRQNVPAGGKVRGSRRTHRGDKKRFMTKAR